QQSDHARTVAPPAIVRYFWFVSRPFPLPTTRSTASDEQTSNDAWRDMAAPVPPPVVATLPAHAPLDVRLRDERLDLRASAPRQVELSGATVGVTIRRAGKRISWEAEALRADGLGAVWAETGMHIELRSAEVDGALVISVTLENGGQEPLVLEEIA